MKEGPRTALKRRIRGLNIKMRRLQSLYAARNKKIISKTLQLVSMFTLCIHTYICVYVLNKILFI